MATTSAPPRSDHTTHHRRPSLMAALIAAAAALVVAAVGIALLARGGGSPSSGVQGSGGAVTQTRAVAGFSSLNLAGSNNVTVTIGRPQSVVVRADSNLLKDVTTQVIGATLVIGDTGSFTARTPMSGTGAITYSGNPPQVATSVTGTGVITRG